MEQTDPNGWIQTSNTDRLQEFLTSNLLQRTDRSKKLQFLPPIYRPRSPPGKQWTDQSLLSTENIDTYLAQSDAFQRASFANIMAKWKDYEKNKASRLISSFDDRYNMKLRFRRDDQLTRASEKKYAPMASYFRHLGNENNPKNLKPCARHKRRLEDYEDRHIQDLLRIPTNFQTRQRGSMQSKNCKLPSLTSSASIRSFESLAEPSQQTLS